MTDFDVMVPNILGTTLVCDGINALSPMVGLQGCYDTQSVDEIPLIDCPPQGVAPGDLNKVIGNATAEQEVKKYYVSELIGIKPGDQPSYSILPPGMKSDPSDKQDEATKFISKIFQLMYGNDICDKQGIMFIGKYLRYYCPNSINYNNLNSEQVQFIDTLLQSTTPVMELAKKWANCK